MTWTFALIVEAVLRGAVDAALPALGLGAAALLAAGVAWALAAWSSDVTRRHGRDDADRPVIYDSRRESW